MISDALLAIAMAQAGSPGGAVAPSPAVLPLPIWMYWAPWVSAGVAVVALLLGLWNVYQGRKDRERDRRLSVIDEYWFRVILGPLCIEPVFCFVIAAAKQLRELAAKRGLEEGPLRDTYKLHVANAKAEISDLMVRLRLLSVVDPSLYGFASKRLDSVEDAIVQHCAACSMQLPEPGRDADVGAANEKLMTLITELGGQLVATHGDLAERVAKTPGSEGRRNVVS